jgi:predicted nucleic acid-binding protein
MTAILDTGFIFALTDKTDDNHARVLRVAQIIGNKTLVLPSIIIPNLR